MKISFETIDQMHLVISRLNKMVFFFKNEIQGVTKQVLKEGDGVHFPKPGDTGIFPLISQFKSDHALPRNVYKRWKKV